MPSALSDFEEITTIGTGSYGTCKKVKRQDDGKVYSTVEATFCVMGYIGFTCLVSIGFEVIFHWEKFMNLNFIGLIYPVDLCVRFYAPMGYYAHLCFSWHNDSQWWSTWSVILPACFHRFLYGRRWNMAVWLNQRNRCLYLRYHVVFSG